MKLPPFFFRITVLCILSPFFLSAGENPKVNETVSCNHKAILGLKEQALRADFFHQLDSIAGRLNQVSQTLPHIVDDLTPLYLDSILASLNLDSFKAHNFYQQEYSFGPFPCSKSGTDSCEDFISISFSSEECLFEIHVFNSYDIELDSCSESSIIYQFRISNGRIEDLQRSVAG